MALKIEQYIAFRRSLEYAREWAAMLGKRYYGGRGGMGKIHEVLLNSVVLYFQESDGATNYHAVPLDLKVALDRAICRQFPSLLAESIELMEEELRALAVEAEKEHASLMADAGLLAPPLCPAGPA